MGYVITSDITYKIDYENKTAFVVEATSVNSDIIIPAEINGCKVVSIMKEAFKDNTSIQTVVIPANVEFIGAKAFMNCINLKNIIIQNEKDCNNVTLKLYSAVFANCTSLNVVNLRHHTQLMDWSVFENCVNLENIDSECILGNIPCRTFDGCVKLRKFISVGIETIEEKAFRNVILSHFNELGKIKEFAEDFPQSLRLAKINCPKDSSFANLAYSGYDVSCY